jgi:hypothetical protein
MFHDIQLRGILLAEGAISVQEHMGGHMQDRPPRLPALRKAEGFR